MTEPVIRINGTPIRDPTTITIQRNKIWSQGSGRTKAGNWVGDITNVKQRIDLTWSPLTKEDAKKIFNALEPAFVEVTFLDPKTDTFKTKTFYGGDLSLPIYNYNIEEAVYESLAVSLVEK